MVVGRAGRGVVAAVAVHALVHLLVVDVGRGDVVHHIGHRRALVPATAEQSLGGQTEGQQEADNQHQLGLHKSSHFFILFKT